MYGLSYACQFIVDILILHIHFFLNPQPPEDIYPGSDGQTLWVSTLSVCACVIRLRLLYLRDLFILIHICSYSA